MLWLVALMPLLMFDDYWHGKECSTKNLENQDKWEPISTLVDNTCSSNETIVLEITNFWREGFNCWETSLPGFGSRSWCQDYPVKTYTCIKNLTENLQPYLDAEEKFIADFMIQGHNLTMEALCKDGEDKMIEKLMKDDGVCERDMNAKAVNILRKCIPKLKFLQEQKDINAVLNKSDYCSNYHDAMECVIENMANNCYKSIVEAIFESHMKFCTSNNSV